MNNTDKISDINVIDFDFVIDGESIVAMISPCSWMYPNYGLKVHFESKDKSNLSFGANYYGLNKNVMFKDATVQDVIDLSKKIEFSQCNNNNCNNINFIDETSNRKGACEVCFIKKLKFEIDSNDIELISEEIKDCKNEIKKGSKFITNIIVHGQGDDILLDVYSNYKIDAKFLNDVKNKYNTDNLVYSTVEINKHLKKLKQQIIAIKNKIVVNKVEEF
jgi:hypothetical protein